MVIAKPPSELASRSTRDGQRLPRDTIGAGTPVPSPDRYGPCTLVEAGDRKFLIDADRGATIRLSQLKVPIGRIDIQFHPLSLGSHVRHTGCVAHRLA